MTTTVADATPPEAALLRTFVNTVDHERGSDDLTDPAALTLWLRQHALIHRDEEAGPDDLRLALRLRDGLRRAMAGSRRRPSAAGVGHAPVHDPQPSALLSGVRQSGNRDPHEAGMARFETAAAALPLRLSFTGSQPHLEPVATGAQGGLARLLIAVDDSRLNGTWPRLKICPADDCLWGFYDSSKNRTRVWCAMGVCGNRRKTRAYRARRRHQHEG